VRRTCAHKPALARRTSANAFLNELALPYANNSQLKMVHITSFNEWREIAAFKPH
jgi:hypothetical protein